MTMANVGDLVWVMIGSGCRRHAEAADPGLIRRLQGRYGVVMDPSQMTAWVGSSFDPAHHTVGVRFVRPYDDGTRCVRGGWYRPDEVFPRRETDDTTPTPAERGERSGGE